MNKRTLIFIPVLILALAAVVVIWRVQGTRVKAARIESEILKGLTAEEISMVLKNQAVGDSATVLGITERTETRQVFLNGMREHLALAAEARREGLSEDPIFKINLEYKKNLLLADMYSAKLNSETKFVIPRSDLDAVWTSNENERQFSRDMSAIREIQIAVARGRGDELPIGQLQGESLVKARANWAKTKVLSTKAKSDADFMSRPEIPLRFKILEAGILSSDYLRAHWAKRIRATPDEIAAYLSAHPEFDIRTKVEKAKTILGRALAGENFDKLAREFSEDRSTRDTGGLYENVAKGTIWPTVESAALSLQNGQVAGSLVESEVGYHIVKLEKRIIKKETDGSETVTFSFKHILFQRAFEEPGNRILEIPAPFMAADEIARAEIEKIKRNQFVEAIVRRNQILLPEDFTVDLEQK